MNICSNFWNTYNNGILRRTNKNTNENTDETPDKYANVPGFQRLPLESSISALKATALPRHLLDLAVLVFIVGFGLYVLFLWLSNVEKMGESYRSVFIVFIVTVGMYVIYNLLVEIARILDDDKRDSEFNTKTLGGFRKPEKLLALQTELAELQQRMESEHLSEEELQEIPFQTQQDFGDVVETKRRKPATTNAQLFLAGDRNFSSPLRAPAIAAATATLPAATRDHYNPNSLTNRNASPTCKVDKYQAWQHYLISYLKIQAMSKDHHLLLKIMEMKGSFEGDWDLAISITEQETNPENSESSKQ